MIRRNQVVGYRATCWDIPNAIRYLEALADEKIDKIEILVFPVQNRPKESLRSEPSVTEAQKDEPETRDK